jgi:hypothetical protein
LRQNKISTDNHPDDDKNGRNTAGGAAAFSKQWATADSAEKQFGVVAGKKGPCLPGRLIAGWVQWATGLGFRKINWQAAEAAGSITWPVLPASGYTCPSLWRVAAAQHQAARGEQAQRGPMSILKSSHFLPLAQNRAAFLLSSTTNSSISLFIEPSCVGGLHPGSLGKDEGRRRSCGSPAAKRKRQQLVGLSRHPTPDGTDAIPEAYESCT